MQFINAYARAMTTGWRFKHHFKWYLPKWWFKYHRHNRS